MNADEPAARSRIRELVSARGRQLIEVGGERPLAGATWTFHSHGAFHLVESPHSGLFDRLVVVLPREAERSPEEFKAWADARLARLDTFLEKTNLGRVVRHVPFETFVVATVARRTGHDPGDPTAHLPAPAEIPALLQGLVRDVDLYQHLMADGSLRFVGGLRLFRLPRGAQEPEWKLGLDVIDTVIGSPAERESSPGGLSPLALVRGVMLELAALCETRALLEQGSISLRRIPASTARLVSGLRTLSERASQPGFTLAHLLTALGEFGPERPAFPRWGLAALLLALLALGLWALMP